ncbi:hypothetical protein GIB67_042476 [Kingdonia uniflora]|uniref:Uncharacterized protein n=1 Tax=Kingdonia uniflora TaxID=39325 RepID=A0A7J7M0Z0_9MAGN|nr:hypothetical protein GIB67_042476 [Kingdonia uniflora]
MNLLYLIWLSRNDAVFEGSDINYNNLKIKILNTIKDIAPLSTYCMFNNSFELSILVSLGVPTKARPAPKVQGCRWPLPWFEEAKINSDGSAIGNPGKADFGAVARGHYGEVLVLSLKV